MGGKKFTFALEGVLKLRHYETERAREVLARIVRERKKQEEIAEEARQKLEALTHGKIANGPVGSRALRQLDAFRLEARYRHDEAKRELQRLNQREAEARSSLVERRKDEEALQSLYEAQKAAHIKEAENAECAILDEQAINGHFRKLQESRL